MAAASSSSSSSIPIDGFEFDVFLSFRGTDTRGVFTGFLWKALVDKGINTFFDEEDLHEGDEIDPTLLRSIEKSKMALVVLSKNYASSSFCLNELSHILDSIKGNNRLVWPIFYDVEPSDVRWLKNSYKEAMDKHEAWYSTDRLGKWKTALHQVANLSGTHFMKGDKQPYLFIEEIVEKVSTKIKPFTLHISNNQVGLGGRMKDVVSRLNLESNDKTHMVGIHGIGGIGKTTLAVAVYNSIAHQFQARCFLEKVRENSDKHGLEYLQEFVLSKTLGGKKIEVTSFREGITEIEKRLRQKKVLLVLDDVDKSKQLDAIAGRRDWFGPGSRVIITTRDTQLLTRHGVESKYEVKLLNMGDASELLRQKAFRENEVPPRYKDVLERALRYASGLPLALEVIGSHLFKKTVEECNEVIGHYQRIQEQEIKKILKVSFDALDEEEKCVFLDIACVFKGHELTDVKQILKAHYGVSKNHHINELVDKSLIKINKYGEVTLHDLIQDMGEELVRQESLDPGKRSRLWLAEDIVQVLEENRGTSQIEMIYFDSKIEVKWNGEAFKKMKNLKTLIVTRYTSLKIPKHLPNSLRVMELREISTTWEDFFKKKLDNMRILKIGDCYSLRQIPNTFCLQNLQELSLRNCWKLHSISSLELPFLETLILSECNSLQNFASLDAPLLKYFKVSKCQSISSIPPLKFPLLEEFYLFDCENLKSIPPLTLKLPLLKKFTLSYPDRLKSFPLQMDGSLASLEKLYLFNCGGSLESFLHLVDGWVGKLKVLRVVCCRNNKGIPPIKVASLEELELSCDCCRDDVQENPGSLQLIEGLHWDDTPLKELPFSFQDLTCLQKLYLDNCGIVQFPTSNIVGMSKQDKDEEKVISIPSSRDELLSLRSCNLSDESLATGLKWFVNVKELDLSCSNITTLPECLKNCDSLWKLVMDNCQKLEEIKGIPPNTKTTSAFNCSSLKSLCTSKLLNKELHKFGNTSFLLPRVEIPNWFRKYTGDFSISFWIRNKFPAIVLCVAFPLRWSESWKFVDIKINNKGYLSCTDGNIHKTRHETKIRHLGLFQIHNQNIHHLGGIGASNNRKQFVNVEKEIMLKDKWNLVQVSFRFKFDECGIYVLNEREEDIQFTKPENEVSM